MLSLEFITLFVNSLSFIISTISKVYKLRNSNESIREIREDNSMTQQRIADLLHIGQRTYADYESGKTRIPVDSLLILARFYDVSMDYITGASDIQTEYPLK